MVLDLCTAVKSCGRRVEREMAMYRIGAFAADMLNSIDNVAKETLEGEYPQQDKISVIPY